MADPTRSAQTRSGYSGAAAIANRSFNREIPGCHRNIQPLHGCEGAGPDGLDYITSRSQLMGRLCEIIASVPADVGAVAALNACRWLVFQHANGRALH